MSRALCDYRTRTVPITGGQSTRIVSCGQWRNFEAAIRGSDSRCGDSKQRGGETYASHHFLASYFCSRNTPCRWAEQRGGRLRFILRRHVNLWRVWRRFLLFRTRQAANRNHLAVRIGCRLIVESQIQVQRQCRRCYVPMAGANDEPSLAEFRQFNQITEVKRGWIKRGFRLIRF